MSEWRDRRNAAAELRLQRALPETFPATVLSHALSRSLVPPTPRRAVESYWRAHPLRADRLARALAHASGAPEGWVWRLDAATMRGGPAATFRMPPAPFREAAFARGPGSCCVCGQPVYRYGWHRDLWAAGVANRNAGWHAACVVAWQLWSAPSGFVKPLRRRQRFRCPQTGKRLLKSAEVDHATPLFRVWREHRQTAWPDLLAFWGVPNLQVINRDHHVAKTAGEASLRARRTQPDLTLAN